MIQGTDIIQFLKAMYSTEHAHRPVQALGHVLGNTHSCASPLKKNESVLEHNLDKVSSTGTV